MAELGDLRLNWPIRNDGLRGPSDRQTKFFASGKLEQLFGGSKRGGKTVGGSAKAIYLSYLFPGNRGFMLRNAFTDLRESTLTTFFNLCPPELIKRHHETNHWIDLYSVNPDKPSRIIYGGLGEESEFSQKAKDKAKAKESGWFWIDEPNEVNFEAFRMMISQLCWVLPDGTRPPYMALLTSNPEPGWVHGRYIDESSDDYIMGDADVDAEFIPSLPSDNPGLPPNWEKTLRDTMDEDWVKRYLDGSWEIHEGMVFGELSERIHNLDNYLDPTDGVKWSAFIQRLNHFASLDHASTGISAYERVGMNHAEDMFCIGEYYEDDDTINNHAKAIASLDAQYPKLQYRLIDPSTESKTLQKADELYSVQEAYTNPRNIYGDYPSIATISAARANIKVGLDFLKQLVHFNPMHKHPFTGLMGSPRLFISKSRCPSLWKEMHGIKKVLDKNGVIKYVGRDHAIDNVRYIAMSRPAAPQQREKDIAALPTQDQLAVKSHDKWAKTWGKQNTNNWFTRK
jgi:hypothetical protein